MTFSYTFIQSSSSKDGGKYSLKLTATIEPSFKRLHIPGINYSSLGTIIHVDVSTGNDSIQEERISLQTGSKHAHCFLQSIHSDRENKFTMRLVGNVSFNTRQKGFIQCPLTWYLMATHLW